MKLLLLLVLCSCGTPSAYVAASAAEDGFGYRSASEANGTYKVTFEGNSSTPMNDVRQYALQRAAEISVADGCDYFEVRSTAVENRGIHSYTLVMRPLHRKEEAENGDAFEAAKFIVKCDENDWRIKANIAPKCH